MTFSVVVISSFPFGWTFAFRQCILSVVDPFVDYEQSNIGILEHNRIEFESQRDIVEDITDRPCKFPFIGTVFLIPCRSVTAVL
jgi:hypothetical protein